MNNAVTIKAISADAQPLELLVNQSIPTIENSDSPVAQLSYEMSNPTHVPGAMQGWYELAVALGLTALPASVVASMLASWIIDALRSRSQPSSPAPSVRMIFRNKERISEVEVANLDMDTLSQALEAALKHVDSDV